MQEGKWNQAQWEEGFKLEATRLLDSRNKWKYPGSKLDFPEFGQMDLSHIYLNILGQGKFNQERNVAQFSRDWTLE